MRNEVQLITYVDRFGGKTLPELQDLLTGPLEGAVGGVHLLPFFHKIDGADAGFDPIDHTRVDERLGDWKDIASLSTKMGVMADVIVNHMSSESLQFLDYSQKGSASEYDGLFLTMESVFPNGATEKDLLAVYRPRPGMPFTVTTLANGERRLLWTTFTPQQIDIDVHTPAGKAYLESILQKLSQSGVTMVRLDAVGYAIKKAGTNCFMMPETFEFIKAFAQRGRELGLEVLVEIHSYYKRQMEIAKQVDWVYDFALPPLVLHALEFGRSGPLLNWIAQRPNNAVTVLDTHDGIGIIDIGPMPPIETTTRVWCHRMSWMSWSSAYIATPTTKAARPPARLHPIWTCTKSTAPSLMPWVATKPPIWWRERFNFLCQASHRFTTWDCWQVKTTWL